MTTSTRERDPVAVAVEVNDEQLTVHLADGRTVSVPLEWFPRLAHGTPTERENWTLHGHGSAIGWPDLDEHLSVASVLAGRRSGESARSLERWLAERGGEAA